MKKVVLPVGCPGSGKSTLAHQIIAQAETSLICSTDDFFVVNGQYQFNPGKLGEYHGRCFQKFAMALVDGIPLVIVDNTNLIAAHREPYLRLAEAMGYEVECLIVGEFTEEACRTYAERNVHGVPLNSILRMASSVQLPKE